MATIKITPEELRVAADFLEQKLEAINGEVSALKGKIDEISSNWEGSSQSSFIETFLVLMVCRLSMASPII